MSQRPNALSALAAKAVAGPLTAMLAPALVVGLLTVSGSRSAFNATFESKNSGWEAGTVALSGAPSSVLFNVSNLKPGSTETRCLNVTYTGSLPADVRLYGTTGGALAPYLKLVVHAGSGAQGGPGASCTNVIADGAALHDNTLAAFGAARTNYTTGAVGSTGTTKDSVRSYRLVASLPSDVSGDAAGKSASASSTWEAQSQ